MREYFRFLVPFPVLSVVYPDHKLRLRQRQRPWPAILRILGGTAGFLLALLAVRSLSNVAMLRSNFALNHVAVLPIFLLGVESLSYAMCGLERLAGFDTTPIIRSAYLSRTPAEFWRTVQLPDPRLALPQRLPGDRRPAPPSPLHSLCISRQRAFS